MYLLDTNHCSYILNGVPEVVEQFRQIDKEIVSTCVIVQSELIYMAQNSQQRISNFLRLQNFLQQIRIYTADQQTAEVCGYFRAELMQRYAPREKSERKKFKLSDVGISIHDLWIAAIAIQHGLTVVSADRDFIRMQEVQAFGLETWYTSSEGES